MMGLALALQLAAFVALAIAMPRHGRHVLGRLPGRGEERIASALGWIGLAASLLVAAGHEAGVLALMAWIGAVPVTAGSVLLLLAYAPRWPLPLGGAAVLAVGVALL